MQLFLSHIESPLGDLMLVSDAQQRLHALEFSDHRSRLHRGLRGRHGSAELIDAVAPASIADAMTRYFSGELNALDPLPVVMAGSDLEEKVWAALRQIPAGSTTSYGKLAKALGFEDPRAAIDIGAANGANPIAIVVPCHRVIASNGELKGYAWGLHRKRWLLEHEKAIPATCELPQTATLPGF
ncbi:methylated-DNA--[protein]-cysteine S-methyltransferase [Paraburkholderia sp. CNPSo 3281]|uniref:methylated-DNA--[protein]-cysteine S-methyltransferase n=1 Tax=Paraburkholderia sp. CNPSo 3281 TaxID=2940933 RepID=UPI0020B8D6BC|nr:methylated-DNA--[protein]-cysteine S-methyltransferase [Paraburkholderia sp. CNPSo 3281]MCP3715053.1 methylated-DNA--[protein]-cysteine S-methyltransferase [Paraburkholderia sp. CNPSo 3281]